MDAQSRIEDVAALAALVQALARHEAEQPRASPSRSEAIAESSFRASRDGIEATLLDDGRAAAGARGRAAHARARSRPARARARRRAALERHRADAARGRRRRAASAAALERGGVEAVLEQLVEDTRPAARMQLMPDLDPRTDASLPRRARGDGLGRDRRALRGRGARPPCAHVLRRGPPLRDRADRGARAGRRLSVRGRARRRAPLAARRRSSSPRRAIRTIDPSQTLRIVFGSCRVAVPHEPPYTLSKDEDPRGREVDALYALALRMMERPREEWPSLLLSIGDQIYVDEDAPADARVHPLPARHEPPARRGGARLRGVHAPLLGVVGRPRDQMAVLDGRRGDDVRRPRRPRRLEHVDRVDRGDARAGLVADADRVGARLLLGLPAPRQPLARASSPRTSC